jgi:uncharacterized protein (TIGR02145 family)
MIIFLQLTIAGSDSGPFNLYSDSNGFAEPPFETNVDKSLLEAGYTLNAPDGTEVIKVVSTGVCINSTYITLALPDCILDGYLETILNATPATFITNEDTDVTVQLLGLSSYPNPDYVIASLPSVLQGTIYDPGTTSQITTVPYTLVSSGTTVLFRPTLNYFGNVDSFDFKLYQDSSYSDVATITGTVLAVSDSPIFDQNPPPYDGTPYGTYTYPGTVSDPDNPPLPLVVSVASNSSLPSGWTLVQTPGTNQFTLTGPVPSATTYVIILQVSDGVNVTQQEVSVTATAADPCANCIIGSEIQIGSLTWTTCNLNVDTYRNGDPIYHATDLNDWKAKGDAGIGAWCYYNNDPTYGPIYGKIYNWYAANDSTHGGIGPAGYHLPSSTEWDNLYSAIDALIPTGNIGGKMKSTCPNHWTAPGWPTNVDATNQSGFRGLGAGFRNPGPEFDPTGFGYLGLDETWWESTPFDSTKAWGRFLRKNTGIAYREEYPMKDGYSIRLVKNY